MFVNFPNPPVSLRITQPPDVNYQQIAHFKMTQ